MGGKVAMKGDESSDVIQRSMVALDYRLQGWSYSKIAAAMGLSVPYVHKLVRRRLKEKVSEKAEQVRNVELLRLDKLWVHAYSGLVSTPDEDGVVNKDAVDACLKIMKRRAELLGLDLAPPKPINLNVDLNAETVQFYLPGNGRESLPAPVQPADVVDVQVREVVAVESPTYDEEEDDEDD